MHGCNCHRCRARIDAEFWRVVALSFPARVESDLRRMAIKAAAAEMVT